VSHLDVLYHILLKGGNGGGRGMLKVSDLRMREIVNVVDGKRLGIIKDIDLDLEAGRIRAIILPGNGKIMGFLGKNDDIVIPWDKIKKIGIDVILVEHTGFTDTYEGFNT
jgi:YlmC/YmxH family sporulation protein